MPNYYTTHASELFEEYRRVDPKTLHKVWHSLIPNEPSLACDIGAGSGRDANWLASLGWSVVAVEPNDVLRGLAQADSHPKVQWLNDALPSLKRLRRTGHRFEMILVSAVWMHIKPTDRQRAFRVLTELLAPGGIIVFSLKLTSEREEGREFFPVSGEELDQLAVSRAIARVLVHHSSDVMGRDNVTWQTRVYKLPDDGTGSLPLLRHVIVNDNKASTYKLGLLRALIRIADSMPGMVRRWDENHVEIPFGLVGLFWVKLYHPLLLKHDIAQMPPRNDGSAPGYGFAKDAFRMLVNTPSGLLKVGATYSGETAGFVTAAIRDACQTIQRMPAHYITYPNSNQQIFECNYASVRKTKTVRIDKSYLSEFGTFRIPRHIWMTLGQFACWLEPAIVNEWKALMQGWQVRYNLAEFELAMQWESGRRDTSVVRGMVDALHADHQPVQCIWTASSLRNESYAVDHCFPFSYWPNNDLWNLLPTTNLANSRKNDALPSAELMVDARERMLAWWDEVVTRGNKDRFFLEAEAALPDCQVESGLPGVFEAMQHQRLRLWHDQQLREWSGV